ncbi:MAG: hypothetical protein JWM99_1884 [Verrucomicrobiales bacterium]|nr:hypothetical protein [Verrucomicrobiales bacterium]
MIQEIDPSGADKQTSIRQRDFFGHAVRISKRDVTGAIDIGFDIKRERYANECFSIRRKCVLLGLVNEDSRQGTAFIKIKRFSPRHSRFNIHRKWTDTGEDVRG